MPAHLVPPPAHLLPLPAHLVLHLVRGRCFCAGGKAVARERLSARDERASRLGGGQDEVVGEEDREMPADGAPCGQMEAADRAVDRHRRGRREGRTQQKGSRRRPAGREAPSLRVFTRSIHPL